MPHHDQCVECGGDMPVRAPTAGTRPTLWSVECRRTYRAAYHQRWWKQNRERELPKLSARVKAYKKTNPDYFKKHYAKHREIKKQKSREWYQANAEQALKRQKEYVAENRERFRPLKRRASNKRRAIKAKVFVEVVDPRVVFKRDKGVCGICKRRVDKASTWEIDHVIPISKGGVHSYANVQLAHRRCNRSKGTRLLAGQPTLFQVVAW